jgi:hypothetical protein
MYEQEGKYEWLMIITEMCVHMIMHNAAKQHANP